ncbi:GCN5-related N-acetyltransferase [Calothrix parasitica NIES-267]|uniref:GCN5-related N-acetyltransferase n=1 Tax=Calothrix parasitica NIES-267 TaxID=1973488 RepID=A0A1Z4LKL9_9CYAN|nr:GCN5-related N-acetyltransferase [Calothrix parasitica NIES-267]
MFGNNRELPPGFIVRRVRNSDISDIIKFGDNGALLESEELRTLNPFILIIILLFIVLSFIVGSFIASLFYILLTITFFILIIYGANYLYWLNNINSGECFAIYHHNQICAIIAAFSFDSGSYIKCLLVKNAYRRRGLGSCLINRIRQNLNYPIYVLCFPEPDLVEFYSSNGFVAIEENELPRRIIKSKGVQSISPLIPMMLEEN